MLSQIAKSAANQWNQVEKIEKEWQEAKACVEAAQWMLECSKGTGMEQDMQDALENAKKAERNAYDRVKVISANARNLSLHYADKLKG